MIKKFLSTLKMSLLFLPLISISQKSYAKFDKQLFDTLEECCFNCSQIKESDITEIFSTKSQEDIIDTINYQTKDGWSLIHAAAFYCENDEIMKSFVKYPLKSINSKELLSENTPLHYACQQHIPNQNVVQLLLSADANPNIKNVEWKTPLHFACTKEDPDTVKMLINSGADLNAKDKLGKTPLHYACQCGRTEVIKVLLSNPFTCINIKDNNNKTPLDLSKAGKNSNVLNIWKIFNSSLRFFK